MEMTYTNGTRAPIDMGHVGMVAENAMAELYGRGDNVPNIHIVMVDELPNGKRAMAQTGNRLTYTVYIVYGELTGMWSLPMARTLHHVSRHHAGLPLDATAANAL